MKTLAWIGAVAFVVGPLLAHFAVVPSLAGFGIFALGGLASLIAAIGGIVRAVRGRGLGAGGAVALVVGIVFVALASRGAGVPRINDFTTDMADPPAFKNAATLAANVGRDMAYPPAFADMQKTCCADLRPARVAAPPDQAFLRARSAAEHMPSWTITAADPAAGTIEAIDTTAMFRFQDDIVIRVRPQPDGSSRVDIRSKSRDGKGDMGTNAKRIRLYVAAVEAAPAGS